MAQFAKPEAKRDDSDYKLAFATLRLTAAHMSRSQLEQLVSYLDDTLDARRGLSAKAKSGPLST